jgi:outer membrane protein TolC
LSLSLESYRMGGATTFDQLKNALEQAEQARRQELQARHALERALIDLEETLGVPLASAGVRTSTGD